MSFVQLNELIRDPVVVQLGQTQPSLFDIITYDNQTVDFSLGGVAVFFMRPLLSRTPVINGAASVTLAPVDADGHNVRYDWHTGDVAIEGQYMGWWGYEFPGSTFNETPEFAIIITDHGPGYGTSTGVVVDALSQWMPTTVRALREDPDFGDRFLQSHADYVKRIVMGDPVVTPDQEVTYDPALIEYLSKKTALRLITPAKDYWARQYRQVLTQGPSESATYPDMMKALDDLHERLCRELPVDWLQLQRILPTLPQLRVESAPATSIGDPNGFNGRRTVDPNDTQRAKIGGPFWGLWMP